MNGPHETDIGLFTQQDDADMELRFMRLGLDEINAAFDSFTLDQACDLLAMSKLIDEMMRRTRQ